MLLTIIIRNGPQSRLQSNHYSRLNALRTYKTMHDAFRDIDWGRAEGKLYVVLDPCDPTILEYLTPAEYRSLRKQCISNDIQLEVVANPKTDPLVNPHRGPVDTDGKSTQNHSDSNGDTKPDRVK